MALAEHHHRSTKWLPWMVWGVSCLFVTFQMLLQTAPSVMITDLQNAFAINTFDVSLLSSSFYYTYLLLQIPAGMLVDRIQPRYCLTFCLLGIVATCAVFASAHTVQTATASRIVQGIFSAPSVVPALFLASMWFPSKHFALLAGLTEMLGVSGSAIAQVTLAPISSHLGWRSTIWICALIGLILALLTWLIVRNKPGHVLEKMPVESRQKHSVLRSLLTVIAYPQAWINGLFSGLHFAISTAFGGFWCIPYLMRTYSVTLDVAAATSSMVLFGVALGAPLVGWLSDRLGVRRLPMIISTGIVFILMLVVLFVPGISLAWMFLLLFALGFFSGVYALPFAVMRDIMPTHVRGTAMGYTNMMCILIGSPILQPLIGWIIHRQLAAGALQAEAYHTALMTLPVCLGVAFLLAFFVQETHCGRDRLQRLPA
jgi:MFS family permease